MVNVYTKDISPRAKWIFKLMFEDLLNQPLLMTDDVTVAKAGIQPVLNYSCEKLPGIPRITPSGLLNEHDIREQDIDVGDHNGLPVFFQSEGGDLPFDPFSMAFYLVSRYEEHLPFEADDHGRFTYRSSLAYNEDFLDKAIVNRLAVLVKEMMQKYYPDLIFPQGEYRFMPSIDIDIAYAHLGKGFVRTWGAVAKLMMKGKTGEIRERIRTMQGKARDPYDNFDLILEACRENELDPVFFVLAGDPGPYDRNLSTRNRAFSELLKRLSENAELGIHPSYGAGNNATILKKEIDSLQSVLGKSLLKSRQHFVRLRFPDTYNMLIANGIEEDFSMGYADRMGFRASIASPYRYFNLSEDKETNLMVYPFMFMDTTLSDYQGIAPERYLETVRPVVEETKDCTGTLIGIWHNYALADDDEKHKAFKELIKYAATR